MMTVFLFARMWRRSGLMTDVQFAEMRYAGKPAAFLRGFRAVYLGLLMNCLILGWVTKAMTSIVSVTLGVSELKSLAICVFFPDALHGIVRRPRRFVGRAMDGRFPIYFENGNRNRRRVVRSPRRRRNGAFAATARREARGGSRRRLTSRACCRIFRREFMAPPCGLCR